MTNWIALGSETMKTARNGLGLSYEGAARAIPTSAKTYERWEKRGAVPASSLARVAEILHLEIEMPAFVRTKVVVTSDQSQDEDGPREWQALLDRLTRIEAAVAELALAEDVRLGFEAVGSAIRQLDVARKPEEPPAKKTKTGG